MLCHDCKRGMIYCGECDMDEFDRFWYEEIELASAVEEYRQENERLRWALNIVSFHCAGTELQRVSDFIIEVLKGGTEYRGLKEEQC